MINSVIVWEWCKNVWYTSNPEFNIFIKFVWEWCKNVWYTSFSSSVVWIPVFENDVKMYGTQALLVVMRGWMQFENDVKMYGTQASCAFWYAYSSFENDVKMYGTQALLIPYMEQV